MPYRATSAQAYAENIASGLIDELHGFVYEAVANNPHLTAREISKLPMFADYQIDSVRPRFAELEHAKVIKAGPERKDQGTNKTAVTWTITNYVAVEGDFEVDKPRVFYGVKANGRKGVFYENKKKAQAVLGRARLTDPMIEFIKLREVRK